MQTPRQAETRTGTSTRLVTFLVLSFLCSHSGIIDSGLFTFCEFGVLNHIRSGDVNPSLICSSAARFHFENERGVWKVAASFSASSSYSNLVTEQMQVRRQYWEDHLQTDHAFWLNLCADSLPSGKKDWHLHLLSHIFGSGDKAANRVRSLR